MTSEEPSHVGDATVSTQVPKSLKREIRIEAARQDRPMAAVIREALYKWAHEVGIDDFDIRDLGIDPEDLAVELDLDADDVDPTTDAPADD